MILYSQNLPQEERTPDQDKENARGVNLLNDSGGKPDIIMIANASDI